MLNAVIKISAGFILDLIFGDPYRFPHPVRFIGKFISFADEKLRKIKHEFSGGMLLLILTVGLTYGITYFLCSFSDLVEIFFIYTIFATNSLAKEGRKIYRSLQKGDIKSARKWLGWIVSRETAELEEEEIVRGAVETISENIVDGLIAPLFFLFFGGAPLAMAYKAVNTLDSMVGYKTPKYIRFGTASARMDDILNFLPARFTGFVLMPIAALLAGKSWRDSLRVVRRDRLNSSSPNAGHSEAAVAGALGIQLGGTSTYFGRTVEKPSIGDSNRQLHYDDIKNTIKIMYLTVIVGLILLGGVYLLVGVY